MATKNIFQYSFSCVIYNSQLVLLYFWCIQSVACYQEIPVHASIPCYVGTTARKKGAVLSFSMEVVEETATGLHEKRSQTNIRF